MTVIGDHCRTPTSWPRTRWPRPPSWRWTVTRTGWSPWTSSWRPASDSPSSASCSHSKQWRYSPSEQMTEHGRCLGGWFCSVTAWEDYFCVCLCCMRLGIIFSIFYIHLSSTVNIPVHLHATCLSLLCLKVFLSIRTSKLSSTRINVLY